MSAFVGGAASGITSSAVKRNRSSASVTPENTGRVTRIPLPSAAEIRRREHQLARRPPVL